MKHLKDSFVSHILSQVISKKISVKDAAIKLQITERYVRKLISRFLSEGIKCLQHGNAGKIPEQKTSLEIENKILILYTKKYSDFNFTHFNEFLHNEENIDISYATLHRILTENNIKSPECQHKKKKDNTHPLRPRRSTFGELIQIDASIHPWFKGTGVKFALHGAIDDATGTVMGLWFDYQETLDGYYNMLRIILENYGIPQAFYSDRRTVFEYKKSSNNSNENNASTQFSRCCSQLGIHISSTSVPQAKGRIERLWKTLQSRLYAELALNKINNIQDANKFLPKFTEKLNKKFALNTASVSSSFRPSPSQDEINYYLSVCCKRIIDSGASFSLHKQRYQLCDSEYKTISIPRGEEVYVYTTFDKHTVAVWANKYFETKLAEIPKKNLNIKSTKTEKHWIPAPNHPWRKMVTARL